MKLFCLLKVSKFPYVTDTQIGQENKQKKKKQACDIEDKVNVPYQVPDINCLWINNYICNSRFDKKSLVGAVQILVQRLQKRTIGENCKIL